MFIVTSGKVVAACGDTARPFNTHSMRKAFLGTLYGPYVAAGIIDTGMTIAKLGIVEKNTTLTSVEAGATVADLLRSRSGIYLPAAAEDQGMRDLRPERGSHPPGTFWYYNNWDMNVAGTIFRKQTGESIFEALKRRIADPIGMQDYRPESGEYEYVEYSLHPSYLFRISARDLARFGVLMLHAGRWRGNAIIPESWAREITRVHSVTGMAGSKSGFGMMWRVAATDVPELRMKAGMFSASGSGGQRLYVVPELRTVVVNLVNTDRQGGRRLSDDEVDRVFAGILAARTRP
jgi:CubicO group peptidase (beta-lactamase class C family)